MTALAGLTAVALPASAVDLAKIERKVVREPAYQTRPKYCLLVFGVEAGTRVWLVQDGATLYVDRNGNGDLTEDGEKVSAKPGDYTDPDEGVFYFEAGDISAGPLTHKNLRVHVSKLNERRGSDDPVKELLAKNPQARGYSMSVDVAMPGWRGIGLGGRVEHFVAASSYAHGILQFAKRSQDAPIIHFDGPWQMTLGGRPRLTVGRETDLLLEVGTLGLGAGTFAYVGYEGVIPATPFPKVAIEYPPAKKGDPPIKEIYELKERC